MYVLESESVTIETEHVKQVVHILKMWISCYNCGMVCYICGKFIWRLDKITQKPIHIHNGCLAIVQREYEDMLNEMLDAGYYKIRFD